MRYPVKRVFITQEWGMNGDIYARFGYRGHNGIDLRLYDESGLKSTTCLVFAPHDGVIKERRSDPEGYGNYLKIESDIEGSILAHLKEFRININTHVKEGDLIAIADNTGWSTGSHLHWGYYRLPRDRNNGYGGIINPKPYIKGEIISDNIDQLKQRITDLTKEVLDKNTQITNYVTQVQGWEKKYEECNTQRIEAGASADGFRKQLNDFVAQLATILGTRQETVEIITAVETCITYEDKAAELDRTLELERKEHASAVDTLEKKIHALELNLASLKAEFKDLKDTQPTPTAPTTKFSIIDIIKKLLGI